MGLFKKSYKLATYSEKVESEICNIKDQNRLMEIAIEAKDINVVDVALNNITDENLFYEIAQSKYLNNLSTQSHALKKIKDEKVINRMINELAPTHRFLRIIYDNIENPPVELSTQMCSSKAEDNLEKDLNQMKYPEDAEKIRLIAKKTSMPNAVSKAINMLPYNEEATFLKELYEQTNMITTKLSIINKLQFEDEREFLENILKNGDKTTSITIKTIAKNLGKDDPLLDKEICPKCGAIDSLKEFSEYRRSIDLDVYGQHCTKCGYETLEQTGLGKVKTESMTLRDFMNM
jgi:ribosomal protein L40E